MTRLYVGHLSEETTETDLRSLLADYDIQSVQIMVDETTKKARGFAFVEIAGSPVDAIRATNGSELYGRKIVVVTA